MLRNCRATKARAPTSQTFRIISFRQILPRAIAPFLRRPQGEYRERLLSQYLKIGVQEQPSGYAVRLYTPDECRL
jgi:hypothetical protein